VTTLKYLGVKNIIMDLNPLNAELNPICHLLALLGAHHILHISRLRVKAIVEESVNWIYLVQGTEQLQVLANTVTNLWVPYNLRNF